MLSTQDSKTSTTQQLADFAATTCYEDLPAKVVHDAKRVILDTLACGVGGYWQKKSKIVIDVMRDLGGSPEATLLVTGDKISCANAAYANAEMANALDFDETFMNLAHFANVMLANALAVGERVGATGKDLLAAFAVGFDVTARLALAIPQVAINGDLPNQSLAWSDTSGECYIGLGGAVTAAGILGLDGYKMAEVMGIAGVATPVPSVKKLVTEPELTMLKYAPIGFFAQTGVMAALLGEKGYVGGRAVLDGEYGFWRYSGGLHCDWDLLVEDLGKKWWISEDSFKLYPACRFLAGVIDLFYQIKDEQGLMPEKIDSVICRLHSVALTEVMAHPSLDPKSTDENLQFNLPYLIAMAALGIPPGPAWFSPERIENPRLKPMMRKVKIEKQTEGLDEMMRTVMEGRPKVWKKAHCSITVMAGGQRFDAKTEYCKGDPWLPETRVSDSWIEDKFRICCDQLFNSESIEKAIEMVWRLEDVEDVSRLTALLTV